VNGVGVVVPDAAKAPGQSPLEGIEIPAGVIENWQSTVDLLSKIADVPAALIMRVHPGEIEVFVASHGPGNVYRAGERTPLDLGLHCETVMGTRHELHVPDARKDPQWDRYPGIARGMISYCGLPLAWPNGKIFGTICILDGKEHEYGLPVRQILERFADSITLSLETVYRSISAETLAETERDFLLESSGDLICVAGLDGYFKSLNPAWERVLGYPPRELLSRPVRDFIHPEDRRGTDTEMARLADGRRALSFENRYVARDGSIRNVLWTATLRPAEGLIYCIGKDITKRTQVEEDLRASEGRWRSLFDNLDAGIVVHAPDTSIVQSNVRAGVLLGLTPDQMRGKVAIDPGWRFVRDDGSPMPFSEYPVNQVVASGSPVVGQVIGVDRPAGAGRAWVLVNAYPERDEARALRQVVVTFVDITGRKEAEQALRLQQARLDAAALSGKLGLWDLDLASGKAWRTPQHDRLFGYDDMQATWGPEEAARHVVPQDLPIFRRAFEEALATGLFHYELRINPAGKAMRWIEATGEVIRDESGKAIRMRGTVVDVTDRKQAEAAVAGREEELRTFLDAIPIPAFRKDTESRWQLGNRALFEAIGKTREACLGRTDLEIYGDPAVGEAVMQNDRRILMSGAAEMIEEEIQTPTGPRTFHSTKVPFRDAEGRVIGIVGAALDVTDRRRTEAALQASEARFRGLFESLMDGFVVVGMDGAIRESNEVYRKMLGYSADELARITYQDLTPERWHPIEARIVEEQILPRGYSEVYEKEYRRKDGTVFPVELRTFLLKEGGRPVAMWAIVRDVGEARALQAQLAVASRLAALGTLVAGVAHEVNNPLAAALSDQELALGAVRALQARLRGSGSLDREAEVHKLDLVVEELSEAQEAGRRIERIIKDLKVFGRPSRKDARQRVRLIDVVDLAMRWLPAAINQTATVTVENGGAPDVDANAGQITQVVVNLVTNAAKATVEGTRGAIVIRVGPGKPDMARLEVSDNGSGIEPSVLSHIFEPFFTTSDVGKGTGLGLAICHSIVTAHGGTLTVESELGKGSTFRVELPAASVEA
jgi:PAS domain S-box-containing protein